MGNKTLTFTAVGDVFIADSPFCIGHGVRSMINKKGIDYYVGGILKFTGKSDFNFANLECVLSDKGRNRLSLSSVEMRGDAAHVSLLHETKWQLINIANNHIFQHGIDAYYDTINNLESCGLNVIGDDTPSGSKLIVINKEGIRIGFVGYSLHYEQHRPNEKIPYALRESYDEILNEVNTLMSLFHGLIVCSLHWGYEFMDQPSRTQQEFARNLIDSGVTLILGHHAHMIQGIERYKNGLIVYNLGNFVFDFQDPNTKDSVLLSVKFSKSGIEDYSLIPVIIGPDYCPHPAIDKDRDRILRRMLELSIKLERGETLEDAALEHLAERYYKQFRIKSYIYFLKNWYRYNPLYYIESLIRALFRRLKLFHNA